ncbi:hypothetical protein LINGRAHAP2_LOCUS16360 [Linum grandiflorum]
MPQEQQYPASLLAASPISPSFNSYYNSYSSSDETLADIAARVVQELSGDSSASEFYSWEDDDESADLEQKQDEEAVKEITQTGDQEEEEEGEFEFAVVDREAVTSPISADEIFYNGQIRPLYPLFNTDLLLFSNESTPPAAAVKSKVGRRQPLMKLFKEEREGGDGNGSPSSPEEDELDSVPEGTYCVWNPKKEESSPEICKKKSGSDGADSKRWKLFKDLIYRSSSDGNHKRTNCGGGNDDRRHHGGAELKKTGDVAEVRKVKESEKRQSFRPIRQDLVGVLSNVSGVSRNLHPF